MAHVRQQLRDAVIAALKAADVAGDRVTRPRGYDYNDAILPAVEVDTPDEESGRETMAGSMGGGGTISRNVTLEVLVTAAGGADLVDTMDDLAVAIETAIAGDSGVQAIAHERIPTGMSRDLGETGEKRRGQMILTFACLVLTDEGAPETAL